MLSTRRRRRSLVEDTAVKKIARVSNFTYVVDYSLASRRDSPVASNKSFQFRAGEREQATSSKRHSGRIEKPEEERVNPAIQKGGLVKPPSWRFTAGLIHPR
jgi:hypothetical protein